MNIINIQVFAFTDFTTAIQSAQVGDTINFFIQNDIVFPSAAGITKTLTINLINASSGNVTLSVPAGNTFRHFTTGVAPIPNVSMTVGSGIILDGGSTGGGLFIFGSNCSVTLNGCTLSNCKSALNGGAVQVVGDTARSALIINNDTIITNCSAIFGGGIVASGCDVTLNGGEIIGNTASNSGGGMSIDGRSAELGSTFTINGGMITGNTATTNDGGGINAQNTIISILGGEISNNTAMGFGGGINVFTTIVAQAALRIIGGTIIGNSIRNFGGGIGVQSKISELTMTGGMITQNSATIPTGSNQGGGIYVQEGNTFEMSGGTIFNNTAGSGGGIFLNNSTLNLNGTAEVSANEAAATAGGIYGFQGCTVNVFGDAKVINNSALCSGDSTREDRGGGGIAILSFGTTSTATIRDNAVISGNSSVSYGGGIWTYPNFGPATFVNIEGGTIENNSANFGGGISMGEIPGDTPILTITGGTITNNRATTDGGGIIAKGSLVSVAGCSITNNTAGHDGGGIWIAYAELSNLTVASDVIFSENKASRAFNRNPIDDALYFSHIFATHWTIPFTQGYNNFDISYTNGTPFAFPTDVTLNAIKIAVGAPLIAEAFTFTVFDQNGNPIATATNNDIGDVTFPAITFDMPGVFTFIVRETDFPEGWTPDLRVFPVIVTVTDNGAGQLVASISFPDGFPSFTNTFEQPLQPTTATIQAKKILCGACLCDNDFTFAVFDQSGNEVSRATNDACGNIVFPALTFTQPGVFNFTVRDLNPSSCSFVTDDSIFTVMVTVTNNGSGHLVSNVSYPDGLPVFVNHFCPPGKSCDCCRKK
jgi:pilin isopeptide linkage protein